MEELQECEGRNSTGGRMQGGKKSLTEKIWQPSHASKGEEVWKGRYLELRRCELRRKFACAGGKA